MSPVEPFVCDEKVPTFNGHEELPCWDERPVHRQHHAYVSWPPCFWCKGLDEHADTCPFTFPGQAEAVEQIKVTWHTGDRRFRLPVKLE